MRKIKCLIMTILMSFSLLSCSSKEVEIEVTKERTAHIEKVENIDTLKVTGFRSKRNTEYQYNRLFIISDETNEQRVEVLAPEDVFDTLQVSVKNNELMIYTPKKTCYLIKDLIQIYVYNVEFKNVLTMFTESIIESSLIKEEATLVSKNASIMKIDGSLEFNKLDIECCDASLFEARGGSHRVTDLSINVHDASSVEFNGGYVTNLNAIVKDASSLFFNCNAVNALVEVKNASTMNTGSFEIKNLDVKVANASSCYTSVIDTISYSVSGVSRLKYTGHPTVNSSSIKDLSSVNGKTKLGESEDE